MDAVVLRLCEVSQQKTDAEGNHATFHHVVKLNRVTAKFRDESATPRVCVINHSCLVSILILVEVDSVQV